MRLIERIMKKFYVWYYYSIKKSRKIKLKGVRKNFNSNRIFKIGITFYINNLLIHLFLIKDIYLLLFYKYIYIYSLAYILKDIFLIRILRKKHKFYKIQLKKLDNIL